jgi:hypothetical protein
MDTDAPQRLVTDTWLWLKRKNCHLLGASVVDHRTDPRLWL